ncbi:ferrous iron transport protein B [Spirochaetota bacterium]
MVLAEMKDGQKGIIRKVRGRGAFRKRILEMGFVEGKEIEVIKNAPLKDPIEYKIMDYNVSLRRNEASLIEMISSRQINKEAKKNFKKLVLNKKSRKFDIIEGNVINVALVGNPNSGKTTFFNYASGSKERVGNYSGVTVDAKRAKFKHGGYTFNIVDLPGTYSISPYSPEELYVRNYIIDESPDIVINIVDSSNLERNLYLTTQLIDMDVKVIVALNMYDDLTRKGDEFNHELLGEMLGIPFVPTVSSKGKGIKKLFNKIIEDYEGKENLMRHIHINYGDDVEKSITKIQKKIYSQKNKEFTDKISTRFLALRLLENDKDVEKRIINSCINHDDIIDSVNIEREKLEKHINMDIETYITDTKYGYIAGGLRETYGYAKRPERTRSEKIDNILTHNIFGFPIFLFFMWLTFQLTFKLGEYPMGWIESLFEGLSKFVSLNMHEGLLKDLIVDGAIAGVGGVVVFLPNILILFFMISLLEDTGYMARTSFIMDKLMHKIGLHGKSFIPLIMGFGCNVPAIMSTRILDNKNDRILTMLILPFITCSARLPVYIMFITAFYPEHSGSMLFLIYLIGISFAVISSITLKKIFFKLEEVPFVMELPPYRVPYFKSTLIHMWEKGFQYLKKIAGVVLVASVIIWALGKFPLNVNYSTDYEGKISAIKSNYTEMIKTGKNEKTKTILLKKEMSRKIGEVETAMEGEKLEKSFIGRIGHFAEPVLRPLGFDWKMGVSLITGLAAKEIVVSTMGILYQAEKNPNGENVSLIKKLKEHKYKRGPKAGEPVFTALTSFVFMIFILLYFPCVAVLVTIKRETGSWRWALFSAVYTTAIAWIVSFAIYQVGSLIV